MTQEMTDVLEDCLQEIAAGRATVQDCLDRYPGRAGELAPLLRAAERARATEQPLLAPAARARIEARLLDALDGTSTARPLCIPLQVWRWARVGLALLVIFALLSTVGLVAAAGGALPGSALYPLKMATEEVWLWLAPTQDEPALHLRFAGRRLDEVRVLAERGRFDARVLSALTQETGTALVGAETLSQPAAESLLGIVLQMTSEQERTLSALMAEAPASLRGQFDQALRASNAHQARARQLLGISPPMERPTEPDQATLTPSSTPLARVTTLPSSTPLPSSTAITTGQPEIPTQVLQATVPPETPTVTVGPKERVPPTNTPISPTATTTSGPTTPTPGTPTATAEPTDTPPAVLATATPVPRTATPQPPAAALEPAGCVYGMGYWKNHPDLWPVSSLALGNETYAQSVLLDLLDRPTSGDASLILAQQLIPARLNAANGADDAVVSATLTAADDWLASFVGQLPYDVGPASAEGQEATALADTLEQFNNGNLPGGPANCPSND